MTCAVVDPTDSLHLWAGAAGGGVWETKTGGKGSNAWKPRWKPRADTLNIGSLAVVPNQPKTLYCGTGEANQSADSYPGVGLYKTTDGGVNWDLIARSDARAPKVPLPRYIGALAAAPGGKDVWLGGLRFEDTQPLGGLYFSANGGTSWKRQTFEGAFAGDESYQCHAVVLDPTDSASVFVAINSLDHRSGLWHSADSGTTWNHLSLSHGLPDPRDYWRTSLAICRPKNADPLVLYALVEDEEQKVRGVFLTENGGQNWAEVTGRFNRDDEDAMNYNNVISIDPQNPDLALWGGIDLYRTANRGQRWRRATDWRGKPGDRDYAHADHHAVLVVPQSGSPPTIYDFNDGGLDVSDDGGVTWENRSEGLVTTQFYDLEVAESDEDVFGGGTQDNGTVLTRQGDPKGFETVLGGDGGWLAIQPQKADSLFATASDPRGTTILRQQAVRGRTEEIFRYLTNQETDFYIAPLEIHPADPEVAFVASERVFRTFDEGATWEAATNSLDGSPCTAIEVSRTKGDRVFVATRNGSVFRSDTWGDVWTGNLSAGVFPRNTAVTRLRGSRHHEDLLFATLAGFKNPHIYRSDDAGRTWKPLGQNPHPKKALPNVPHHAVDLVEPDRNTLHWS